MSDADDLKQMTDRAMIAEARVAELIEEQSRIGGSKPLSGSLSSSGGDTMLRQRAEAAESEREDLRAQKIKLESSLAEKEEELKKARAAPSSPPPPPPAAADTSGLKEQLKSKEEELAKLSSDVRDKEQALQNAQRELEAGMELKLQITRLEEELKEARAAAASPPPPPAQAPEAPDTSALEEQLKSREEQLAGLSSAIREKEAQIDELAQRVEAIPLIEAERDGLAKKVEDLSAQADQQKAQTDRDDAGVVEQLKAELEEMAKKEAAAADIAKKLTRENMQLLEKLSAAKREHDQLTKQMESTEDVVTIVSHARKDGTQPETTAPPQDVPEGTSPTQEVSAETLQTKEVVPSWPANEAIREVLPQEKQPQDAPKSPQPVMGLLVEEPDDEDAPEDSLPELEPLPGPVSYPPPEQPLVSRPSKGSWFLKLFLFLVLAGGTFLAAWHYLPGLLDSSGPGTQPADVIGASQPSSPSEGEPEDTKPEPPPPPTEVSEEPAEEAPEEATPEEPTPEEPVDKVVKKKKRTEKRKPKKTAKAREPEMTVGEAKKQVRRLLSSKQLDKAQILLADWVKRKPRDAGLHYLYGRLYLMLGKKDAAVDQLEEAIELAPRMASAYHDLGAIYLQMGDNDLACETLGHFVRLKPNHQRTPAIRDLMKKIKCP
ncbi:tetratricopeptide repeat protein [Myxococcota bacterium]